MIDWDALPNFTREEFTCRCGCGRVDGPGDMDFEFLKRLQEIRDQLQRPMPITSGFRCSIENMRVSKTGPDGPHTTGHAADIQVSGPTAFHLVRLAYEMSMTGIGQRQHGNHSKRFVHLDDLDIRVRPRTWTYRV